MSQETMSHLNTNTLIGNTEHRGTAWHYRADLQSGEPNHYPGPIPIADIRRRLFDWTAESRPIAVEVSADMHTMTHISENGDPLRWQTVADRQAIVRSDTDAVMGIFALGYARHQYDEWLLTTVANILDDTLSISSAGLLRKGAIAWVEVSVPESITTPEGVTFRPNLLATTSFDGSIATTFKRTCTATVCDNTRELALSEQGQQVKVKHSRYSQLRLADARAALAMVHSLGDEFAAEIATLCAIEVTRAQWAAFLDGHVPLAEPDGTRLVGRALTIGENKRAGLQKLYTHDLRVAPWAGTAHGVLQAVNTAPTTKAPSEAPTAPNATNSAPSPATSAPSTATPGHNSPASYPLLDPELTEDRQPRLYRRTEPAAAPTRGRRQSVDFCI